MLISDIAGIESTNKTRVIIMTLTGVSCVASSFAFFLCVCWGEGGGSVRRHVFYFFYFSFFGVSNFLSFSGNERHFFLLEWRGATNSESIPDSKRCSYATWWDRLE